MGPSNSSYLSSTRPFSTSMIIGERVDYSHHSWCKIWTSESNSTHLDAWEGWWCTSFRPIGKEAKTLNKLTILNLKVANQPQQKKQAITLLSHDQQFFWRKSGKMNSFWHSFFTPSSTNVLQTLLTDIGWRISEFHLPELWLGLVLC